ncbi:unnamed protein product [Trichobilharzia regenti]|nr:unnamed protein product [Trichobilharzia regenti]
MVHTPCLLIHFLLDSKPPSGITSVSTTTTTTTTTEIPVYQILVIVVRHLNIKPSTKTKTIHPPNSLPSKKFSNNKSLSSDSKKSLDPSAQAALKSNIPTGSTTTIITTATTVTTSSHLNQTIISSSSSGSLSPSSSGIPMPRQLNFYQHSNNNNNNMPSSANVRPKDSPVKVVDRAQYLNFSSHSQTALQGNHVMSTYPDSYDNSSHMNKADNKYLTNLPNSTICSDNFGHPSRTLNQYQHQQQPQPQTVQKCYASPMNYDQSMTTTTSTTMGKVQLTNHHSLPSSSMGQQSNYPGYLAGSTFQERSAHQMTNHQMSFPPSQPPPVPPPQPPPPPPPHHQQQHQHHPQQLRPQELQYTSQTINPGNIGVS